MTGLERTENHTKGGLASPILGKKQGELPEGHISARAAIAEPSDILDTNEFFNHN